MINLIYHMTNAGDHCVNHARIAERSAVTAVFAHMQDISCDLPYVAFTDQNELIDWSVKKVSRPALVTRTGVRLFSTCFGNYTPRSQLFEAVRWP